MGFIADIADNVGTFFNAPELGISEAVNRSKPTANTGRIALNNNITGSNAAAYNTANNLKQSSDNPAYYNLASFPTLTAGTTTSPTTNIVSDPYAQAQARALAQQQAQASNQKAQLQGQLGTLDNQLNVGLGNIDNSYNRSANRLDEQNGIAQRDYNDGTASNGQSYSNTRNSIISNTRAQANALQRLLGQAGAGNSSAAYEQAPYAAGLQGTQNLGQAQNTYGTNQRSLDNNWGDTQRSYKNSLSDLNDQKYQQQNGLRASIAQTRASLLSGIQNADGTSQYNGTINDLLGQISNLGQQYASPVLRAGDVSFASPSLAQYGLGKQTAATNDTGAAADVDPTFLNLLNQQKDKFGNLIQS